MTSISEHDILALASELWESRGEITLDEIDGAFYWRICRGELAEQLEALAEAQEREPDSTEQLSNIFDHLYQMEASIPGFSQWIDNRRPPQMRDPLFRLGYPRPVDIPAFDRPHYRSSGTGGWVLLGVRNSQWRGDDVERALRKELAYEEGRNAGYLESLRQGQANNGGSLMAIDLTYYGPGELHFRSKWISMPDGSDRSTTVESPVILCTVAYPPPSDGLIAAAYDAIAINRFRWNEHLYGFGVRWNQQPEVAIRTWTIGLLMGAGSSWNHADAVAARAVPQKVSWDGFKANRKDLIRRVPEARKFVYVYQG